MTAGPIGRGMLVMLTGLLCAAPAAAQSQQPAQPDTTLPCKAATKLANGKWRIAPGTRFSIGGMKNIKLADHPVGPGDLRLGGTDLYALIEARCGRKKP